MFSAPKVAAFGGLVLSGLCLLYGMMLFWMGTLRLFFPGIFAKPGQEPGTQALLVLAGLVLLLLSWVVGKNSQEQLKKP